MPPDDYWPLVRELCDKYGILLIHDEVITGFGRTGKWFGCQHCGVEPDIMTMAKGISSGYVPLAAIAATDAVFDAFKGEPPTTCSSTRSAPSAATRSPAPWPWRTWR